MSNSLISKYLSNKRLIIFAYLSVILLGLYSWFTLSRELMPTIDLPVIVVSCVLPKASPNDTEELLTIPLEDKIRSIKEIDEVESTSAEGMSLIIVHFSKNISADDALREVQQKVAATSLPAQALTPTINKIDFSELPVWSFTIEGQDRLGLDRVAEKLKKQLEQLPTIDRVETSGFGEREIAVVFDREKLARSSLSPFLLSNTIDSLTGNLPLGKVQTQGFDYLLGVNKQIQDIESLRATIISAGGKTYRLGELAQIYEQDKPEKSHAWQIDNQQQINEVVTFNVYKTAGTPIDKNAKISKETAAKVLADYPQFTLRSLTDYGKEINDIFSELENNMLTTAILVFLVMLLFLGLKEAVIATMSIPLVMLFTFSGIVYFKLTLNFISLFSLLLALGMLVDNAIVVATSLSREYAKQKQNPLAAGIKVWQEFFMALLATNLTTVWAFLPLIIMSGVMGVFFKTLSIVVTLAILGSALIAFLLTLPLGIFLLQPQLPTRVQKLCLGLLFIGSSGGLLLVLPKNIFSFLVIPLSWLLLYVAIILRLQLKAKFARNNLVSKISHKLQTGWVTTTTLEKYYRTLLNKFVNHLPTCKKLLFAIGVVTLTAFALPIFGQVKNEFFPKEDDDQIEMQLVLPIGTNKEKVAQVAKEVLPQLLDTPYLTYATAQTNRGSNSNLVSASSNENKILFTINLEENRPLPSFKIATQLRERWKTNPYGEMRVLDDNSSITGEADIGIGIAGDDLQVLTAKIQQITSWLKKHPGVSEASNNVDDNNQRIIFVPNQEQLIAYGLSLNQIGGYLRSVTSGFTLGKIMRHGEEIEINWRTQNDNPQLSELTNLVIPTNTGSEVTLGSLGKFVLEPSLAQINRNNYQRIVNAKANVVEGYSATSINQQLQQYIVNELNLPSGYRPVSEGASKTNQDAIQEIYFAMGIAGFLILFTLVMQMRSFRKAFIIMTVIPVAISGVFIIFALFGIALSMPAFVGILALFGIVVNNSILIVERINQNLDSGKSFAQSVIDGSVERLQPILLTSLTTIIGLVPITLSNPMWQGLGGSIIAGLTFSGVLLLLYVPALFVLMFHPQRLAEKNKRWQQRWQLQ